MKVTVPVLRATPSSAMARGASHGAALRPWPGWYLDDWGWLGEEPAYLGEVLHSWQCGLPHDEQLQRQVPLGTRDLGTHGHPRGARNTDGRPGRLLPLVSCPAPQTCSSAPLLDAKDLPRKVGKWMVVAC